MVRGLLILNSSYAGARDLWWPPIHQATKGYHVYRAFDATVNWQLISSYIVPGSFFRDESRTEAVTYTVQPTDWYDNGENGMRVFRLPDVPYATVVKGRPVVASSPDDVSIAVAYADGSKTTTRAAMVIGHEQTVFLRIDRDLPEDGDVSAYPIIDFDNGPVFTVTYQKMVNYVDIFTNMLRTFYTVVPVGDRGELHAPGAPGSEIVDSGSLDRIDYMLTEQVRRNAWLFEQVAEPAYLMIRRVAGQVCGCRDNITGFARTSCGTCYETGIVGGYYGPFDFLYVDPNQAVTRVLDENNVKVERTSRSYLGRTPIVQDGDMVIRRTGERLIINEVNYTRPRGVLVQQDFNVTLLAPGDTRYMIPILDPGATPVLYNPVLPDPADGVGGAEPVYTAPGVPGKQWENPDVQAGQTTRFGRIQS